MMNKKLIILFSCLFLILLSGCTTVTHSESDVASFLKNKCDITADFIVSDQYETLIGEDGYEDKLWTVTLADDDITFHVLDDYYYGSEWVTNQLRSDFENVVAEKMYSSFSSVYLNGGNKPAYDGLNGFVLTGSFRSRNELEALLSEYDSFREHTLQNGYDIHIKGNFVFDNPIRNYTSKEVADGDISLNRKASDSPDYARSTENYILAVLDYRFADNINEFSADEIASALDDYKYPVSVLDSITGEYRMYDDIIANQYGYGISFSALYEILVREGYPVEGDAWDYTFSSPDGDTYEISYYFNDYPFEDGNGYYYLKNGEQQPMDYFFYNHFRTGKIFEMTGIQLKDTHN